MSDLLEETLVVVLDLLPFQLRNLTQLHIQDRFGLNLCQPETPSHFHTRRLDGGSRPNESDNLIQEVQRNLQAFPNVRRCLCTGEFVASASNNDFFAVCDVVCQCRQQVEQAGLSIDQSQHDNAERLTHGGVFEQEVDDPLGHHVTP